MKLKKCNRCLIEKSEKNFKRRVTNRLRPYCVPCQQEYDREYWQRTKRKRHPARLINGKNIRIRNAKAVFEYLRVHPCVDCGEKDPIVLEFDHIGEKERDIANLVGRRCSLERIFQEIEKCEVRCANCHRRKTAKERGWYQEINLA